MLDLKTLANIETLRLDADHMTNKYRDEASWVNMKLYEDSVVTCMSLANLAHGRPCGSIARDRR